MHLSTGHDQDRIKASDLAKEAKGKTKFKTPRISVEMKDTMGGLALDDQAANLGWTTPEKHEKPSITKSYRSEDRRGSIKGHFYSNRSPERRDTRELPKRRQTDDLYYPGKGRLRRDSDTRGRKRSMSNQYEERKKIFLEKHDKGTGGKNPEKGKGKGKGFSKGSKGSGKGVKGSKGSGKGVNKGGGNQIRHNEGGRIGGGRRK